MTQKNPTAGITIEQAASMLAAIVAVTNDVILYKDIAGNITSWNGAAEQLFGYPSSEMMGQPIRKIIPIELQSEEDWILRCLMDGEPIYNLETLRVKKDGTNVDVILNILPVRNLEGKIIGAVDIMRSNAMKRRYEMRLDELSLQLQHCATHICSEIRTVVRKTFSNTDPTRFASLLDDIQAIELRHKKLKSNSTKIK